MPLRRLSIRRRNEERPWPDLPVMRSLSTAKRAAPARVPFLFSAAPLMVSMVLAPIPRGGTLTTRENASSFEESATSEI